MRRTLSFLLLALVPFQTDAQNGCGNTINWTNSLCQQIGAGALNTAYVNGVLTSNAWSVISRHGEFAQSETECNVPGMILQSTGLLTITTEQATSGYVCANFDPSSGNQVTVSTGCSSSTTFTAATSSCYLTGDMQWNTFSFTYGTVIAYLKIPPQNTGTWPTIWFLGTNCQSANKYTGETPAGSCPDVGQTNYREIDMFECIYAANWCQMLTFNPNRNSTCLVSIDGNWHKWAMSWSSSSISMTEDGTSTGCSYTGSANVPTGAMFMILQTQTSVASEGGAGPPQNGNLPTNYYAQYLKVCDNGITAAQCDSATGPSDPTYGSHVIFFDNFTPSSSAGSSMAGTVAAGTRMQ